MAHYDPRNPAFAVLEPGIQNYDPILLFLFISAACIGVFLVAMGSLGLLGVLQYPASEKSWRHGKKGG